ncbi:MULTISPECIES: NAD(P)/FAD-dependent oxidoreductase [Sphingobacterium]|jgi:thioredoxin reductase (NADPH)|uniref:NAD(P)/FAD-dependent oxidoreductase n=1 Tax=Sphingobacterium TaxID=28453 RepID=UPI0008A11230|nr:MULTISPECIES: NAD(P)/FAD-dependent oxidoreductase [Sphingobacterium]HAF37039.1 NAD(P)/FAD-dependent oxidoreductase [Sphingobacterium sp.]MDF2853668.1 ferredoxin--NADP(+) reductase [Sphingobacterium multivorum]OFV13620.1 ferredoxin--NADP(+) reductase [Sphingobacterium sp. HMSC13C05]HAK28642.1 NAD(P)/FAD-dependent oxidoreductase [Sphingobacterium sp.]HAU54024.1 NAD(P)/FAD-dependent oxidoreductase [Sphingobacterium sp.]
MINTDICIIGAGPVGLFAVFEAGLLKMRCHLIDVLPQVGGQLSEIYPHKPIYDIPGYPSITAQELIDKQLEQIKPFDPTFTLGERVEHITKQDDGSFIVETNDHTMVHTQVIVIAGGLGCFEPRKPEIPNLHLFEGKGVDYMVKDPAKYRDKKIVIAGGGDSALDWTFHLADIAQQVTLIHRSDSFRGAPDSAEKVFKLAQQGKINLLLSHNLTNIHGNGYLSHVETTNKEKEVIATDADYFIPLYGLTPKLGPIADWGLNIDKNAIAVDTFDYSTNIERIYAIGDINTYPGKLKLILCGYHEAALMCQSAFKFVYPDQKLTFKYTTVNGINTF